MSFFFFVVVAIIAAVIAIIIGKGELNTNTFWSVVLAIIFIIVAYAALK